MTQLRLRVPKATGTAGDDLVAWGLAILVSEVVHARVSLRDDGDGLLLNASFGQSLDEAIDSFIPDRTQVYWLGSTSKNRIAPSSLSAVALDRDVLREAATAQRSAGPAGPIAGDAPLVTTKASPELYSRYFTVTTPGKQWDGYNGFVELIHVLGWPRVARLALQIYDADNPLPEEQIDAALRNLGLGKRDARWRNPPGFLFPGLNKGPTMRLVSRSGQSIGPAAGSDWIMVNREDRHLIELYLAYAGYFGVAQVRDIKGRRTVLVPSPSNVLVPDILPRLDEVTIRASTIDPYVAAQAALRYTAAVAGYLRDLSGDDAEPGWVISGVHLAHFWKPNQFTFAVESVEQAPLPRWAGPLYATQQLDETVRRHLRQLTSLKGSYRDESKLGEARRSAIAAYARTLDGTVADWLWAVATWFPALRESANAVYLWHIEDVRRICMALEPDLQAIFDNDSFKRVSQAIRNATVAAHFARKDPGRAKGALTPQYDLVTSLAEAAHRHPDDFLRELCYFIAHYNDQLARPSAPRLRLVRQEDLQQITRWVSADRRGLIPAAILAFGTSVVGYERTEEPNGADEDTQDTVEDTEESEE